MLCPPQMLGNASAIDPPPSLVSTFWHSLGIRRCIGIALALVGAWHAMPGAHAWQPLRDRLPARCPDAGHRNALGQLLLVSVTFLPVDSGRSQIGTVPQPLDNLANNR